MASEARDNLKGIMPDHGDYDAMQALADIAETYPNEEPDDDAEV